MALKIYLNPEHGGSDGGASYAGLVEKTLNLKAAKYCRDYLKKYDCTVFLSRESDTGDLLISQRIADLKKKKADVVITIAHNAGGGQGCEIFYWKDDNASKRLAVLIEKNFKEIGQISRGVKVSSEAAYNFGMVREPSKDGIPAVLSEFAFLDNAQDRLLVDSDEDLRKEGEAIGKAVKEYFNLKETAPEPENPFPDNDILYRIQIGAFKLKANAESYVEYVKRRGFDAFYKEDSTGDGTIYRVQAGAFKNKNYAQEHLKKLREAGIEGFIYESVQ